MSIHSIQSFSGDVEIPGNLRVVSLTSEDGIAEFGANNAASNVGFVFHRDGGANANVALYYDDVNNQLQIGHTLKGGRDEHMQIETGDPIEMNVHGNVYGTAFFGDGGNLSNLVTDLSSVANAGAISDKTITLSNALTGLHVSVGNVLVDGNVTASTFYGDGSHLTGIAANFEEIIINGNVTTNVVQFENATHAFITTGNVGIANSHPDVTLSIGSNIMIDDTSEDYKIDVDGNVRANGIHFNTLTLGTNQTLGFEQIALVGNTTPYTIEFNNVNTGFYSTRSCGIGIVPSAADVGTSGLHVDGHLRLGGAAGTDDQSEIKLRSSAQLLIHGNDTGQDNSYSNVIVKSGGHPVAGNASSIEICGAYDDPTRQEINFSTKGEERVTIDAVGNVNVTNNVVAHAFVGDGSMLSGLVTDLQSVTESSDGVSLANGQEGSQTDRTVFLSNVTTGANVTSNLVIQGNLILGSILASATNTLQSATDAGPSTTNAITISDTTNAENRATGALKISGGVGVGGDAWATNVNAVSYLSVGKETPNHASNAFEVVGDSNVGKLYTSNIVTGHLEINAVSANHTFTLAQVVNTDNEVSGNTINLSNTTASTSSTTGALRVGGGVGVGANLHVGGNVYVGQMETSTIASNVVTWDATTGRLTDSAGLISNKLAVVSEVPASALSANTTTVANHGDFVVTASGHQSNYDAWKAFNRTQYIRWNSPIGQYDGASNVFNDTTRLASSTDQGAWIAIEFPYRATLRHLKLTPGVNVQSFPKVAKVYGTNDSLTWTVLKSWSDLTPSNIEDTQTVVVDAADAYKRFALVTTQVAGNYDRVSLEEIKLYTESFTVADGVSNMTNTSVSFPKRDGTVLSAGDDAVLELKTAHARDEAVLKRYPEMKMGGLDNQTKAGVTVSSSSTAFNNTGFYNSNVYNQIIDNEGWHTSGVPSSVSGSAYTIGGVTGEWHKTEFPNKLKVQSFHIAARWGYSSQPGQAPEDLTILGSNDDSTWVSLKSVTGLTYTAYEYTPVQIDATEYYKYLAVVVTDTIDGTSACTIGEMYWMAREYVGAGDEACDVTIQSTYNAPDLTSAALYIDGLKGSAATDHSGSSVAVAENNATYDSTENAWVLSGAADSNIVSGNLASLVGDHPHSVSAWVKADQLNGDGLFHVGTAEGEGDAACRVGFVDDSHISWGGEKHYFSNAEWHNVTYTYNGEGSDKKLYLDGRLVGTAKNEDTFGEYPPFDMSGYSEFGYTVSTSNDYTSDPNSIRRAWNAYEEGGQPWMTEFDAFSRNSPYGAVTSGAQQGVAITDTNGTSHFGHYNKLETPFKLQVGYLAVDASVDTRRPGNVAILGSNDDENWDLLYTNASVTDTQYNDFIVNSTKGYKYHMFMVKNLDPSGEGALYIVRLQYYGHRENDLVRFPDPTNVLKYPHVAMTGQEGTVGGVSDLHHAQRGYEVTASSMYVDNSSNPYQPWRTFNSESTAGWFSRGLTGLYGGTDYAYGSAATANLGTDSGGSATAGGEWLKLRLPRKLVLSRIVMYSSGSEAPEDFTLYGSNDGSSWTEILSETGLGATTSGGTYTPSSTPSAYRYFGLVIKKTVSRDNYTGIRELELYGTEPENVIARIGDGYDGKVRNLRVYSTALSDARVQEIFDADKDELGLAKSSISVYRGRLGVGTARPKGALTVMDEVGELEEFPPKPMIDYQTYMEGHGNFRAYMSSDYNLTPYRAWNAFDKNNVHWNGGWATRDYTWDSNGSVLPDTSNVVVFDGIQCHWLELELPYAIKPDNVTLLARLDANVPTEVPAKGRIYGSKDGVTWDRIRTYNIRNEAGTLKAMMGNSPISIPLSTINYYKHLRLTVEERYGGSVGAPTWTSIGQLRYFGTREQGASTLHNGELSLTRNLTVPRIGPPLDADDTPRRDRLVVEYNTSTNPVENGVVKDTSGHGWDANFYGSSAYDASEKAITLSDGTDDYLETGKIINGYSGDIDHTFALWVKPSKLDMDDTGNHYLAVLGSETAHNKWCAIAISDKHLSHVVHSSIEIASDTELVPETWQHIAISYTSGGSIHSNLHMDYYINGEKYTGSFTGSGSQYGSASFTLDLTGPLSVRIGSIHNGTEDAASSISNFKLFDVALTAAEVKRLYYMGRCDEGHHVVNFSKTRVGIGLGDGEAPRAALDVRGSMIIDGIIKHSAWPAFRVSTNNGENIWSNHAASSGSAKSSGHNNNTNSSDEVIPWKNVVYDNTGSYTYSGAGDYKFTAPVSGIYHFHFHCLFTRSSTSSSRLDLKFFVNGGLNAHLEMNGDFSSTTTANVGRGHTTNLHLNAGDYVQAVFTGVGGAWGVYNGSASHFNVFSGQLIAAD